MMLIIAYVFPDSRIYFLNPKFQASNCLLLTGAQLLLKKAIRVCSLDIVACSCICLLKKDNSSRIEVFIFIE